MCWGRLKNWKCGVAGSATVHRDEPDQLVASAAAAEADSAAAAEPHAQRTTHGTVYT